MLKVIFFILKYKEHSSVDRIWVALQLHLVDHCMTNEKSGSTGQQRAPVANSITSLYFKLQSKDLISSFFTQFWNKSSHNNSTMVPYHEDV